MKRHFSFAGTISVAVGLLLALLPGLSQPASAAGFEYNETTQVGAFDTATLRPKFVAGYGEAGFDPNEDELWVWDLSQDGSSVGLLWQTTDGRSGLCRNKSGASGHWGKCNKNFNESSSIKFRMGRCNANATRTCKVASDWDWTIGWSAWKPVSG